MTLYSVSIKKKKPLSSVSGGAFSIIYKEFLEPAIFLTAVDLRIEIFDPIRCYLRVKYYGLPKQ